MNSDKPSTRLHLRFSLRSLLIAIVVISAGLSVIGNLLSQIRHQRWIVSKITKLDGKHYFDYESEINEHHGYSVFSPKKFRAPASIRKLLGKDAFAHVAIVHFPYGNVVDDDLALLSELPHLV